MELRDFLASLNHKRVGVVGVGVSNAPLAQLLVDAGVDVTLCDATENDRVQALAAKGAHVQIGQDYLENLDFDVIFRTPGLHPSALSGAPEGAEITSEMELFFEVCPCKIIGVTGSDGKTTTTTMIAELLRAAGYTVHLGGNIGMPLLADVPEMRPDDFAVIELSSFQLITMRQSPDIAVVTNLSPNHLDVHASMEEYIDAKANIFRHQLGRGKVVLNYDCARTRAFAACAEGDVTFFSRSGHLPGGVWLKGESICCDGRPVLPVKEIALPGAHNVENYMAAIAAVDGLVPDELIRRFARTFSGVAHRIEFVCERGGVRYYNDSIASSPSRAIAGLRAFDQKVILIAGGRDKKVPFDELGAEIVQRVKTLVLTGEAAGQIRAAVEQSPDYAPGSPGILSVSGFEDAVLAASRAASDGDVVLLSPACTSFDRFSNFAERGDLFKQIVSEL